MGEGRADYFKQHVWNIIQCFLGFGCLALEWMAYRSTHAAAQSSAPPAPSVGAAMTPHYYMPWYLWAGIAALAFSVIIPAVIGMVRKRQPSSKLTQAPSPADDAEADRLRREEIERKAELWRAQESRKLCDEERRKAIQEADELKARYAVFAHFTPLQLDALTFSQEILQYLKDFEATPSFGRPGAEENHAQRVKRGEWLQRMMSGYELRFGPRGRDLTLRFREKGVTVVTGPEPRLFEDKVRQWADELVALAYKIDGNTLHVGTLQ